MSTKTCQSCAHFCALVSQCRAHAPVPLLAGMDQNRMPLVVGAWPATNKDNWCGEHRIELTRLN